MIEKLLLKSDASLRLAMQIINDNALGIAFVVDSDDKLSGVLTDGDIRRALLSGAELDSPVISTMTVDCVRLPVTARRDTILGSLMANPRVTIIPLVDSHQRPVDYASVRRLNRIPIAVPDLGGNELDYVTSCLTDGWISSQGPFVGRFEQNFAKFVDVPHAIATSNGTTALHLALLALGIGPGDEVVVPDLTFAASVNAVIYCGATPVLADVERDTWNLDPAALRAAINPRTKAVMVVHLYGQPAAMSEIAAIARKHRLLIVEDAAEALGATYDGRHVGGFGDTAAFSFFGNKLITTGEGGMFVARAPAVAERARILRDHGMCPDKRYWHDVVGFNYRMTNLQAAVGVAQLERIEKFIARKKEIGRQYRQALAGIPGLALPVERRNAQDICWLFSIIADNGPAGPSRDDLMATLAGAGIDTRPVFYPLHRMPPYKAIAGNGIFPNSDWISDNGLSLPSAVSATDAEISYVSSLLARALAKKPAVVN